MWTVKVSAEKEKKDHHFLFIPIRSAHGVKVIIVGNEHCNTSSNPGLGWLHFT